MNTEHKLVTHARERLQQRGISKSSLSTLLQFGTLFYAGKGRLAYHMGRKACKEAKRLGLCIEKFINIACIVEKNERVVTVMHAPRIPKHWRKGGVR